MCCAGELLPSITQHNKYGKVLNLHIGLSEPTRQFNEFPLLNNVSW